MNARTGQVYRSLAGAVTVASAIGMLASAAVAQKAAKGKAPAKPQSAWVKLCEDATFKKPGKDGKTSEATKKICLTHHERLDGNTGTVIVSAAIRRVEGQDGPQLMIMVPLGMALQPGVKAAVYTKDQWERAAKKERVEDKELKPISLKYSLCHPAGCTAELPAPKGFVKQMEAGGGLMILALNAGGQPVAFPVPLVGFAEADKGKPVDSQKYGQARAQLMAKIRERLRLKMADQRAKAAAAAKAPDPQPIKK